jgi:hypothetical protein
MLDGNTDTAGGMRVLQEDTARGWKEESLGQMEELVEAFAHSLTSTVFIGSSHDAFITPVAVQYGYSILCGVL